MQDSSPDILIVDDDRDHLALVARYTAATGFAYALAKDGIEAIDLIDKGDFQIIITDMVMPTVDGMQIIKFARAHAPQAGIIVMTGFSKNYSYTDVIKAGASDFIEKPFSQDELTAKLSRILREKAHLRNLQKEVARHQETSAALLTAKNAAEKSNEIKNNFINTISHEFLTPMNGIMGFSEILDGTELTPRQREFMQMIKTSADRLMRLINQLLDFSQLESCRQQRPLRPFLLNEILDDIITALLPKIKDKKLVVKYTVDKAVPTKLAGDPDALKRILNNLAENAAISTKRGKIKVKVEVQEKLADNALFLQFSVKDTGCGIPEDKQDTIFEAFTQAEDYLTRSHDGAGLGLAMCKDLVQLLDGKIWMQSKSHHGSTFYFTAKFKIPPDTPPSA